MSFSSQISAMGISGLVLRPSMIGEGQHRGKLFTAAGYREREKEPERMGPGSGCPPQGHPDDHHLQLGPTVIKSGSHHGLCMDEVRALRIHSPGKSPLAKPSPEQMAFRNIPESKSNNCSSAGPAAQLSLVPLGVVGNLQNGGHIQGRGLSLRKKPFSGGIGSSALWPSLGSAVCNWPGLLAAALPGPVSFSGRELRICHPCAHRI